MSSPSKAPSNVYTILFVFALCLVAALVLSVMATLTRAPQLKAQQLDLSKQILAAARIYNPKGYFQIISSEGEYVPAVWDAASGVLVPGKTSDRATADQIYAVAAARLRPRLTNAQGEIETFEQAGIDLQDYLDENAKHGYAQLPEKLFYLLFPNESVAEDPGGQDLEPAGYIIPLNGFGLWGPIYGFVALERNADTVIGTTWQAPAETPGLGAEIQNPKWQAQFEGKEIFRPAVSGPTNFETASLGIMVVKGKVSDVLGDTPRAKTAVDGVSGATITGDGVAAAFKDSLEPYRPLLIKLHEQYLSESEEGS